MALTKVTGQVINNSTGLVVGVTTVGGGLSATDGFFSGIVTAVGNASFSGNLTVGGVLTYEDVTNVDSVGLITARNGVVVGSGITLSKDGDIFFTGIMTGDGSGLSGVTAVGGTLPVTFNDDVQANFGTDSDFHLTHSGSNANIQNNTGDLIIRTLGSGDDIFIDSNDDVNIRVHQTDNAITCIGDGAVTLYHDNSAKLATSSSGVTVTGTVAATSYTGDGSGLTGVGIATTVATGITGITTVLDLSNNDHKITVSGITTVDVRGGTEGESHSLRIINSGITTVGFSTYFLFPSGSSPIIPTTDGTLSMISFTVHRQGAVGLATQLFAGASVNFS